MTERGKLLERSARAVVARLPLHVAEREIGTLRSKLGWKKKELRAADVESRGPGNVILATLEFENLTEMFAGFGKKGVSAERVAGGVAKEIETYLNSDAPAGEYLTDQLLLPLGIAAHQGRTSRFRATTLSDHATTHIEILKRFLTVDVAVRSDVQGGHVVEIKPR